MFQHSRAFIWSGCFKITLHPTQHLPSTVSIIVTSAWKRGTRLAGHGRILCIPYFQLCEGGVKCISAYLVKVNNSISESFTGKGCFSCVAGCRRWQSASRFHVLCVVIDTFCNGLSWSNGSFPCLQCKMHSVQPLLTATSQERPFLPRRIHSLLF